MSRRPVQCHHGFSPKSACKACLKSYRREYYLSHRESLIAYSQQYVAEHREQVSAYKRSHYRANKDGILDRVSRWQVAKYKDAKTKCLQHYGDRCARCDESETSMLSFDHIIGDGGQHRRSDKRAYKLPRWLVSHDFPEGFQTLCYSCNWRKHIAGHSLSIHKSAIYRRAVRAQIINRMGGLCVCCGQQDAAVLTFDHIDGGGGQHRRSLSDRHMEFWIRKHGAEGFQILCRNCNISKYRLGQCAHKRA
jgi:hypothetical protein